MIHQKYEDVVTNELLKGNLDHDAYEGFLFDYRVLHCLLRKYQPKTIMEIGTNIGSGVNVIAAAVPDAQIFSLDLDYETMCQNSKQYPLGENLEDRVGSAVTVPYTQLRGDSLTFDYSKHPCHAYFIDGEHDFQHPFIETMEIMNNTAAEIIIYHDADMKPVMDAIQTALKYNPQGGEWTLYKIENTRIAYLI